MSIRSCMARAWLDVFAKLNLLTAVNKIDSMAFKHLLIYPFWIGVNQLKEPC